MDALIHPIQNVVNLVINKHVIFEDMKINSYFQVILSTIFASIIGFIINGIKNGNISAIIYWNLRPFMVWKKQNPLEFYPEFAPKCSADEAVYMENVSVSSALIAKWIRQHHADKNFIRMDTNNNKQRMVCIMDSNLNCRFLPIWYEKKFYVYICSGDANTTYLYSNNYDVLSNAKKHIIDNTKTTTETTNSYKGSMIYTTETMNNKIQIVGGTTKINQNITFEYLHFDRKEEIKSLLHKFNTKTMYKSNVPMENKLGILLHGEPGCGKTRFVSACANYLKKDVLVLDTRKLQTTKNLDFVLDYADKKQMIIMMDEIDCMDGVVARNQEPATNTNTLGGSIVNEMSVSDKLLVSCNDKDMIRERLDMERDKLNLGYLLSKLDGLESAEGRVIIATTNYPDKIDKALLRPGRIGVNIHMTLCSHQMIIDILTMIFRELSDIQKDQITQYVKPFTISPSEIIQQSVILNDVDKVLQLLIR
jgi:SpoVK/Ycf46/Vps4 family AAA+-type ATPase